MASTEPVLLGIQDVAISQKHETNWRTNKIGSSPDCVPTITMQYPLCGVCSAPLFHILQVYCPLEGSPYHRTINVFACTRPECLGKLESWKVLRSQYAEAENKNADGCRPKEDALMETKEWCNGADDWGMDDDTESAKLNANQLLGLNLPNQGPLSRDSDFTTQLEGLSLAETRPMLEECSNTLLPEGAGLVMPGLVSTFQGFYLSVVDEEEYSCNDEMNHAQELLKEYQQREELPIEQMLSASCDTKSSKEKYEKAVAKHGDKMFLKFMKRISVCHEQVLRYSRNGQPLFITVPPPNLSQVVPKCSNCGGCQVFEFQLMPALVSMLKSADQSGDSDPLWRHTEPQRPAILRCSLLAAVLH
ncbi:programmed cell death protein 2-like isoform X2 [Latimeria chalumnae]|uniref:programmed cell death protein 2-like isoform X2 n=1 Tax=Latimeria chalumnae TaxID=7897 RepID=UPI00313BEEE5